MTARLSSGKSTWLQWSLGLALFTAANTLAAQPNDAKPQTFSLAAKDTLNVVQLDHGDTFRFKLKNGEVRTFKLEEATARIVEKVQGGILYSFECKLLADGQPLTLRRFVCSQETFYEPWVVNGVRIWFSSSRSIFKLVPIRYPEAHDPLDSDAVLLVQDATLPICPEPMRPWFPIDRHFIDVATCYNGDDPWLGPYLGQACHMGLDINMKKGTLLYAPIDFDDQWIFSADHRWRGVRRWDNGDIWALQSHHVDRLLIKERTPLKAGVHYGEAAGKGVGSHQHSHFEFRLGPAVLNKGQLGGIEVDPWILFWQIFETDKEKKGLIKASIDPLAPATTGQAVQFTATSSRAGKGAGPLRYYWTFGDGGWAIESAPKHNFLRPGVYPVTLVIDDGKQRATQTQHVTVNGKPVQSPALVLHAPDEVSFLPRPIPAADVYGWPVKEIPHTLRFTVLPHGFAFLKKEVYLRNAGQGVLPRADLPLVSYPGDKKEWLRLLTHEKDNQQSLKVGVDPRFLAPGRYEAIVTVRCPGAVNGKQSFRVEVNVRPSPNADQVIVDDKDDQFFATPFFWVGHQFLRAPQRGYQKRYLTNGQIADDALVRYTPDLAAGRYEVSFHPKTPAIQASFTVRVRHAAGEKNIRFSRSKSGTRSLGVYDFAEGNDGFVEIQAKNSEGLVVVDALVFQKTAIKSNSK